MEYTFIMGLILGVAVTGFVCSGVGAWSWKHASSHELQEELVRRYTNKRIKAEERMRVNKLLGSDEVLNDEEQTRATKESQGQKDM